MLCVVHYVAWKQKKTLSLPAEVFRHVLWGRSLNRDDVMM